MWLSLFCAIVTYSLKTPLCFALSCALYIILYRIKLKVWQSTDDIKLTKFNVEMMSSSHSQNIIDSSSKILLTVVCEYKSEFTKHLNLILEIGIIGIQHKPFILEEYKCEKNKCIMTYKASAPYDPGNYQIGPFDCILSDPLSLFQFQWTLTQLVPFKVINHKRIRTPKIQIKQIDNSGFGEDEYEAPGHGSTYLSLREWTVGDSVRRIDWRRSLFTSSPIVRVFEKLSSSKVTILIDQSIQGQIHGNDFSTEDMCRSLISQSINDFKSKVFDIQFISMGFHIPFGEKAIFTSYMEKRIDGLSFNLNYSFKDWFKSQLSYIPPGSNLVIISTTGSLKLNSITNLLNILIDQKISTKIVAIDTFDLAENIIKDKNFEPSELFKIHKIMTELAKIMNADFFTLKPHPLVQTQIIKAIHAP